MMAVIIREIRETSTKVYEFLSENLVYNEGSVKRSELIDTNI